VAIGSGMFLLNMHGCHASTYECCFWYVLQEWLIGRHQANYSIGQLVGAFGAFYNPYSGDTPAKFQATINKNV
jgi:hypothetical protein